MRIIPTGHELHAARALVGWQQKRLALEAGLHPGTVNRMEKYGPKRIGGIVKNIEKALDALERAGVTIAENSVTLTKKSRR